MSKPVFFSERELSQWISKALSDDASVIVERWLDWLTARRGTRAVKSLPRNALLNHIPPVVRTIAKYVHTPLEAVQGEMVQHLRLHASVRRAQGYSVQELLTEFDGLARIISLYIEEKLESFEHAVRPRDAVEVLYRLSAGTRAIGFVTVGMYQESENGFQSRLATELEAFGDALTHELKTPLQTARIGASAIRQALAQESTDDILPSLTVIERAIHRANDLLDDVRVLAMAQRTGRTQNMEAFRAVYYQIHDELKLQAQQKDVELKVIEQLPTHAVERTITQLCLINVVSNSIKYADVDKSSRWVHLRASAVLRAAGPRVIVEVRDNGVGVPAELLPQVFQRQFRAHPSLADGVGMGLSVTQQLLAEIGGEIAMSSTQGQGTTVELAFPAHVPVSEEDRVLEAPTAASVVGDALEDIYRTDVETSDDSDE